MTKAPTTRETADHAELARLRQHIANLKLRPGHHVQFGTPSVSQIRNYWNRDLADDLDALLSEIAALRGEVERVQRECDEMALHGFQAVQAERQRDELRTEAVYLLRHVQVATSAIHDPEYKAAGYRYQVTPMANATHDRISTFLANQGADQ